MDHSNSSYNNTMKFSIHSKTTAKRFTNVFTNLCSLTDTAVLHFNNDGLYVQGMDTSHVSLYEARFHSSWFSTYTLEDDDIRQIAISLEHFKKVLSTRGDDQLIYIEYNGGSPDTLTIIFRSMAKESKDFPREYEMMLMDVDTETLAIPDEERSVQFYVDAKTFSLLIKQMNMFNDSVTIKCTEEEIWFMSKGTEGSMRVNMFDSDRDYIDEYMIDEDYKLKMTFALRYFDHFCAFQKVSSRVRLSFTNDFPVEMFYSLDPPAKKDESGSEGASQDENEDEAEEEEPKSYLRFFLAPKLSDGDDEEHED